MKLIPCLLSIAFLFTLVAHADDADEIVKCQRKLYDKAIRMAENFLKQKKIEIDQRGTPIYDQANSREFMCWIASCRADYTTQTYMVSKDGSSATLQADIKFVTMLTANRTTEESNKTDALGNIPGKGERYEVATNRRATIQANLSLTNVVSGVVIFTSSHEALGCSVKLPDKKTKLD
jgi:hypothetical protein